MDRSRVEHILRTLPGVTVVVLGDFFLDRYFEIDSALAERSVETGLVAHQVVGKRLSPGAAGTVVCNLRALGVGHVICLGVVGVDGEGFELKRALVGVGADPSGLIEREDRVTPCYSKPMLRENEVEREMERLDIKNRSELPLDAEAELIEQLGELLPQADAVIIADQVQERNCGVVTDRVREHIARMAASQPSKVFFADSRVRIGEFRGVLTKPNKFEVADAILGSARADALGHCIEQVTLERALACAAGLHERTGKAVLMTCQEDGIFIVDEALSHVPAASVTGEIDPCGAGDSCAAGIVSALCAGATLQEAALFGNVVASITVQKLRQTGTASPKEVLARFDELASQ